ncbi:hypothetical protein SLA2020_038420 [Shorea laevis]
MTLIWWRKNGEQNLDWWLSEDDQKNDTTTESKYSSSEYGDEDHGMVNAEIFSKEYDSIDEGQLQKEGDPISKEKTSMVEARIERDVEGRA